MRTVTSELLRIPGIGESKRRQLLEAFGSLQGVRDATLDEIAELPGFGQKTAEKVMAGLAATSPTAPAASSSNSDNSQPSDPALAAVTSEADEAAGDAASPSVDNPTEST
jgi:excinuclease ABC subunit C